MDSAGVRFEFGRNWQSYAKGVDESHVNIATMALQKLLPDGFHPAGKSFLDIGCGSGLHATSAARLGFSKIVATDYDQNSVATTVSTAKAFGAEVDAFRDDILNTKLNETFDVVYSWGVLHHTGNMAGAIRKASELVTPGGELIIAIYVKTPLCGAWRKIKHTYCSSPAAIQKIMAYGFHGLRLARQIPSGELFQDYKQLRGMDRFHDSIDWLGGYPYESASALEVEAMVGEGFSLLKSYRTEAGIGVFGTGCGEYVFRRI